ncbi:hypothetical protein [Chromobacterium sp. ATCC 53434]|uniref:hypothetical protein n=1 Tax=Chromobacterium sp. (strain ATCC 53434 / SC 14030) TaxID=2059672 RepID=UPI0013053595|nr:hypothetical protein [Chromobacterium sp. ATCC 53434]
MNSTNDLQYANTDAASDSTSSKDPMAIRTLATILMREIPAAELELAIGGAMMPDAATSQYAGGGDISIMY